MEKALLVFKKSFINYYFFIRGRLFHWVKSHQSPGELFNHFLAEFREGPLDSFLRKPGIILDLFFLPYILFKIKDWGISTFTKTMQKGHDTSKRWATKKKWLGMWGFFCPLIWLWLKQVKIAYYPSLLQRINLRKSVKHEMALIFFFSFCQEHLVKWKGKCLNRSK